MRFYIFCAAFVVALLPAQLCAQVERIQTSASLTEAHTIIGMQYFVVGTLAQECRYPLNKPESFVKETQTAWLGRNAQFVDALTRYQTALFSEVESKYGKDRLASEKSHYRDVVVAQGSAIVQQFFSKGDKLTQCQKALDGLASGYFDITPQFPLYAEAMALVQATSR